MRLVWDRQQASAAVDQDRYVVAVAKSAVASAPVMQHTGASEFAFVQSAKSRAAAGQLLYLRELGLPARQIAIANQ